MVRQEMATIKQFLGRIKSNSGIISLQLKLSAVSCSVGPEGHSFILSHFNVLLHCILINHILCHFLKCQYEIRITNCIKDLTEAPNSWDIQRNWMDFIWLHPVKQVHLVDHWNPQG